MKSTIFPTTAAASLASVSVVTVVAPDEDASDDTPAPTIGGIQCFDMRAVVTALGSAASRQQV
ncbi:uncharacterized protein PpBr36_09641 [Pyricularia pennisetigena]|uniref:uncharacterized protein n=1 Tax=Pyricularia pennisetigena TaxID=1578925 RepID=UPI001152A224|nr:uncharacterized protein PpBr36_09641 [Pyricularia pennisetigena]TLS21630.1 hypothetical protein PpBr36_09641 [Pyricularia pennisetigena]